MVIEVRDTLHIKLKREIDESYDLVFGTNLFSRIAKDLKVSKLGTKYAIITDSNVGPLYAGKLKDALKTEDLEGAVFTFKAGEENKTRKTKAQLEDAMFKSGFGRDSAILALGGGVVGDMAGFVASTYNRGVPVVQIPTTILAMADSSTGGKTGLDTEAGGKNSIGIFYQPYKVYFDINTLDTLKEEVYIEGLAETIKHGFTLDLSFFEFLEREKEKIKARNEEALVFVAKKNCFIKGNVVERDPKEKGIRKVLNYGHTIAHSIEKLANYKLSHGACVSIGMIVEGRAAIKLGFLKEKELERLIVLLNVFGLPIKIPKNLDSRKILETANLDKKTRKGKAMYVLPKRIGEMESFNGSYSTHIEDSIILEAIEESK